MKNVSMLRISGVPSSVYFGKKKQPDNTGTASQTMTDSVQLSGKAAEGKPAHSRTKPSLSRIFASFLAMTAPAMATAQQTSPPDKPGFVVAKPDDEALKDIQCPGDGVTATQRARNIQRVVASVPAIRISSSTFTNFQDKGDQVAHGSGIVVDAQKGILLTNAHIVEAPQGFRIQDIKVTIHNPGKEPVTTTARGKHVSGQRDWMLLQLAPPKEGNLALTPAVFHTKDVPITCPAIAVGYPMALESAAEVSPPIATLGTISGNNFREKNVPPAYDIPFYVTDAAINPGNSGGALATPNGYIVGMNTYTYPQKATTSVSYKAADLVQYLREQGLEPLTDEQPGEAAAEPKKPDNHKK